MNKRAAIASILVAAIGLSSIATLQTRVDTVHEETFDQELLYLPNRALLTHFTGGLNVVLADMLWIQCIQYTAKHFHGDGKFRWLAQMGDVITDLDPYFVGAYRYVGMFLAALQSDDQSSLDLIHKGMRNNPDEWRLPYEASMVYLLNRRDEPGSPEMAARYLSLAVGMGIAPPELANVAQGLAVRHDFADIEREMWEETIASSTDPFMRELAQRKLALMDCRTNVAALQENVDAFHSQRNTYPESLAAMYEASSTEAPTFEDSLGGYYFLAPDGIVLNTSVLDEKVSHRLGSLRSKIRVYTDAHDGLPESLQAMVDAAVMPSVPDHPYPTGEWHYDPATGEVTSHVPNRP